MKFLITGSQGQLGLAFQKILIKKKISSILIDRKPLKKKNYFSIDISLPSNFPALEKIIKENSVKYIINCASYNLVDKAEDNVDNAFITNFSAVKNLAKLSKKMSLSLVHYSTDYIFDGETNSPYKTSDKPNPISIYGKSKLAGEKAIHKYLDSFFIIRTSWVFGEGENFVKKVIGWSKEDQNLRISNNEFSSPTYANDLAKASLKLFQSKAFGTYNITNSPCSRYEWAKFILQKIGYKGKIKKVEKEVFNLSAQRPAFSVLDNTKFEQICGYRMPTWQNATKRYLLT